MMNAGKWDFRMQHVFPNQKVSQEEKTDNKQNKELKRFNGESKWLQRPPTVRTHCVPAKTATHTHTHTHIEALPDTERKDCAADVRSRSPAALR